MTITEVRVKRSTVTIKKICNKAAQFIGGPDDHPLTKAHARAGLIGNPSDSYYGKTISLIWIGKDMVITNL